MQGWDGDVGGSTPAALNPAPAPDRTEQPASDPAGRMGIVLPGGVAIRVDAEVDGHALRRVLAAPGRR